LARREISKWRLSSIPKTAFKKQLKMNSVPGPIQLLMEILTAEYPEVAWTWISGEDQLKVTAQTSYENYATWSESRGFRSWDQLNSRAFNVEIKQIVELNVVKETGQSTCGINISKTELCDSLSAYLKDPNFGFNETDNEEEGRYGITTASFFCNQGPYYSNLGEVMSL